MESRRQLVLSSAGTTTAENKATLSLSPWAALLPICTLSTLLLLTTAAHLLARRGYRLPHSSSEAEPLIGKAQRSTAEPSGGDAARTRQAARERATRWTLVYRGLSALAALALLGVSVAQLVSREGSQRWASMYHWGMVATSTYLIALPLARMIFPTITDRTKLHEEVLSASLSLSSALVFILPFLYRDHPSLDSSYLLGFTQAGLTFSFLFFLLVTPNFWDPVLPDARPHPAQTASPLSRHLFFFLEARMLGFYFHPSSSFLATVPTLPDFLHTSFVRSRMVWTPSVAKGESDTRDVSSGKTKRGGLATFCWLYKIELAGVVAYTSIWIVAVFVSPLSLNLLLQHVQTNDTSSHVSPYVFVLGIFLAPIVSTVAFQWATYSVAQLGLRLRSALGLSIFLKVLKVREGWGDEDTGQVNNLVGTDIDTLTSSLPAALQLFGIPPKLIVSLVSLYLLLGWSAFVALATVLAFAPLSYVVSREYGNVQGKIMKATDSRVNLLQELLGAVRIIKMFAWEGHSLKRIAEARSLELKRIRTRAKVFAGMMLLSTGIPLLVTLATFGAYVFGQGQTLTASTAFTAMSLFSLLREAVISSTYLVSAFMRARVSLTRIDHYLSKAEELDDRPSTTSEEAPAISKATFRWSRSAKTSDFRLHIDDLKFPKGKTTLVIGDVGSGKTALLYALLGEIHCESGNVCSSRASVSFASQSAWLQDDTIQNNITFFSDFDEERYRKVLFQCALEEDLHVLPDGDQTRVGEKGLSVSGGQKQRIALARACYAKTEMVLLDDVLSALDSNTVSHVVEHCLNGDLLEGRTVILVTHYDKLCVKSLSSCELVVRLSSGSVESTSHPSKGGSLSPDGRSGHPRARSRSTIEKEELEKHEAKKVQEDEGLEVSWSVYRQYFGSMGGVLFWVVYALINVTAHVLMLAQGWWVSQWVNADGDRPAYYFSIYAVLQLIGAISMTLMYLALIYGALQASRKLHGALTASVFNAPIRWFDITALGKITNRFSKDVEVVDSELVEQTQPVFDYAVQVAFVAIMICYILPIFLLPAALISGAFFLVGQLYVRNALVTRKHVSNARSPLFSTLGDAASGVTTIRAFRKENVFAESYVHQTDNYNRMQLYENGLERWLQERSDLVGATVSGIVGLLAIPGGLSSGTTGFLVSTGLEFTSRILYVVRSINQQQLSINSAHRIIQYSQIEQEPKPTKAGEPPASWPSEGAIEIENFSARYAHNLPDVLKGLHFSIKAGEKVGVVGHSGCGKSSFALAFLRFIVTSSGSITVDGRSLSTINLDAIRSRITLIPQEPILLSGTLRTTLDPAGECDDAELWAALQSSRFVGEDETTVTLDTTVAPGGSNFSQGQRNLLSLARALVRNSKIALFDEASASLDNETDKLVQRVLRKEFQGSTMITIAHRLESIMDFDRVLVLHEGEVAEFDTPRALLDQKDSKFRGMVEATGSFDELYAMTGSGRDGD